MTDTHLAFKLSRQDVTDGILIPKFYDPDLAIAFDMATAAGFDLPLLGDLLRPGDEGSRLGGWIPREFYGTGHIPFVRTSDLSHWRIRADYKKGVSEAVYDSMRARQDVRPDDILMVAHGTYLVGSAAIVTARERKLVLQDHVFRLRVDADSGVGPHLLLAALSTAFVRRQVRSRQFSADIIDKLGERHLGLRIPIPRDPAVRHAVELQVRAIIERQLTLAAKIQKAAQSDLRLVRERPEARYRFTTRRAAVNGRILIPKYYDPIVEQALEEQEAKAAEPWRSLGELVGEGTISIATGVEVGKMAYGTGDIPFLRTSDLADWEVKRNVKQGISEPIYRRYRAKAAVEPFDILLVRDGTYLVGSTALVMPGDVPGIICGGLFRIRVLDRDVIDPHALLAFLNLPVVRQQMRSRQFTRDVIDTLGHRILEVRIPSPHSKKAAKLGESVAKIMVEKAIVKQEIGAAIDMVEPPSPPAAAGRPAWSMR